MNSEKLSSAEKRDLIIQSGIEAIPYVGGPLSTLLFSGKQQLRLNRLEIFLNDIILEVEAIKDRIANIERYDEYDKEALSAIFEELFERVEHEQFSEKQKYFKICFKKTLINPVNKSNYDERRFFLDILGSISPLQITILRILIRDRTWLNIGDISVKGVDRNVIAAAAIKLVYLGLAVSRRASVRYGDPEEPINQSIRLNSFGYRFCEFCLTEL